MFVRMPHVIMGFHERILSLTGYETFLKHLGISFEQRIHKDIKKLDYRNQMGPEMLKVM